MRRNAAVAIACAAIVAAAVIYATNASAVVPPRTAATEPSPAAQAAPQPASERQACAPLIGDDAPAFEADSTMGAIKFPQQYKGSWVIFFSHPGDFTPVCTTEIMTFASMIDDFAALNCRLLGLSVDSRASHIAWMLHIQKNIQFKDIKNVAIRFPVISDAKLDIARQYGMIHPSASDSRTVRAVFVVDPEGKVRAVLYYPMSAGRNVQEIRRLLVALQTSDKHHVATPANWQEGDEAIVPPPCSCDEATQRMGEQKEGERCVDWFLCFKKLPK